LNIFQFKAEGGRFSVEKQGGAVAGACEIAGSVVAAT
jgi:hypothetical protein